MFICSYCDPGKWVTSRYAYSLRVGGHLGDFDKTVVQFILLINQLIAKASLVRGAKFESPLKET
jgi:hypothetical protein